MRSRCWALLGHSRQTLTPHCFSIEIVPRLGGAQSSAHPRTVFPAKQNRMNKLQIKANWNDIKEKLKQKFAHLTDEDLTFTEGQEEDLLGRLAQRLGKSPEEVRREIDEAQRAFTAVLHKAEDAFDSGREYARQNTISVILCSLIIGVIIGALLFSRKRKEPDKVQAVRDWLEGTLDEFSKRLPQAKKQAQSLQGDIVGQAQALGKKLNFWCR
jgi:uncharacterized protein YjbJ (UPF0337 family)